jgi:hypothetical protein
MAHRHPQHQPGFRRRPDQGRGVPADGAGPLGWPVPADFEITEARPGAEVRYQVISGQTRPSGGYYLSTEPAGTRVRFALEYQPKGLLGLMNTGIQRAMKAEVAQLERLKDVLAIASAA